MSDWHGARGRTVIRLPTDRVIALARIVIAAFAIAAKYFIPPPASTLPTLMAVLGAYLIFATIVAGLVFAGRVRPQQPFVEYAADVAAAAVVMFFSESFSESQVSPFIVFFIFVLLSATLHWNWRGAVWTTALLLALLAISVLARVAAIESHIAGQPALNLDRAVIRGAFMLMGGAMLAYFGAYRQHSLAGLAQLTEEMAVARERMRVARDLHDGVLQTLAAAGLQLKSAAARTDAPACDMIENIRHLLADEQGRLRLLIDEKWPLDADQGDFLLHSELQQFVDKLKQLWGCRIQLSVTPRDAVVRRGLGRQISFILAETVANAINHGGASSVDIALATDATSIIIRLRDNGRGLTAAEGTYDHAQLAALNIGPASLRRRIAELNGSLSLSTSLRGVELNIRIPL
jgi:signal transduction histidine kinase